MTIKDLAEAAMNALLRAAKDEPKLLECSAEVLESLVFTLMGIRVSWEEMVRANDLVGEREPSVAGYKSFVERHNWRNTAKNQANRIEELEAELKEANALLMERLSENTTLKQAVEVLMEGKVQCALKRAAKEIIKEHNKETHDGE